MAAPVYLVMSAANELDVPALLVAPPAGAELLDALEVLELPQAAVTNATGMPRPSRSNRRRCRDGRRVVDTWPPLADGSLAVDEAVAP